MTVDSVWVTACGVNPPATSVQVGTKKLVGDDFSVKLTPSVSTIVYDPRGIATAASNVTVKVAGSSVTDSVIINTLGKVIRE